jgi:hypothetical protein
MFFNQLLQLIIKHFPNLLLLANLTRTEPLLILQTDIPSLLDQYPDAVHLARHASHVQRRVPKEVLVVEQSQLQRLLLRRFYQHDVVVDPAGKLLDQELKVGSVGRKV